VQVEDFSLWTAWIVLHFDLQPAVPFVREAQMDRHLGAQMSRELSRRLELRLVLGLQGKDMCPRPSYNIRLALAEQALCGLAEKCDVPFLVGHDRTHAKLTEDRTHIVMALAELGDHLLQLRLHSLVFSDTARDAHHAYDLALGITHRRSGEVRTKSLTVFLPVRDLTGKASSAEDAGIRVYADCRVTIQDVYRLTYDFGLAVAESSFRSRIELQDLSVEVYRDDHVKGTIDEGLSVCVFCPHSGLSLLRAQQQGQNAMCALARPRSR
jgi:hypothetical protein